MLLAGCVIAVAGFWTIQHHLQRPAAAGIHSGVQEILALFPSLRPQYDEALQDGVLSLGEANQIVSAAEKIRQSH